MFTLLAAKRKNPKDTAEPCPNAAYLRKTQLFRSALRTGNKSHFQPRQHWSMRAAVRVGQIGNLRAIGNPPGNFPDPVTGRLPIGRRLPTCPTKSSKTQNFISDRNRSTSTHITFPIVFKRLGQFLQRAESIALHR